MRPSQRQIARSLRCGEAGRAQRGQKRAKKKPKSDPDFAQQWNPCGKPTTSKPDLPQAKKATRGRNRPQYLHDDIADGITRPKAPCGHDSQRGRRIKVSAGHLAHSVGHGEDGKAKCERDAEQANSDAGKGHRENRAAAAAQHQPESSQKFRR
jgi:hypothetical protein